MPRMILLGAGYVGLRLAPTLLDDGWSVVGTTRKLENAAPFEHAGLDPALVDDEQPTDLSAVLFEGTHWLISAAPRPDDPFLERVARARLTARPAWIGYLSTTGVYGDTGGAWVDERSEPRPDLDRTRHRLAAEQAWLALGEKLGAPVHIFRLGGIYGPGRNALEKVKAGKARLLVKPGKVFNRVHVDDIVQALRASMARPRAGAIYNVVDGAPLPPEGVTRRAFELLQIEPPPEEDIREAEVSPMLASFYAGNTRVRSALLHEELGVTLRYPNGKLGIEALHRLK